MILESFSEHKLSLIIDVINKIPSIFQDDWFVFTCIKICNNDDLEKLHELKSVQVYSATKTYIGLF